MATRNRTPFTILGCLSVEPMSGYDIKRFIDRTIVHFWSESFGQIYPALRQLEADGLIEGHAEPSERGPDRRVYRLTETGRKRLEAWLREPAAPVTPRYEHSLKLFFGFNVDPSVAFAHVRRLRDQAEEDLHAYRDWEQRLVARAAAEPDSPALHWLIVLRGGVRHSEMVLEWCAESEASLRSLETSARVGARA